MNNRDGLCDRNIRIEGNMFRVYDSPLITAKSTAGLSFVNNKVVRQDFGNLPEGNRPGFNLNYCSNVTITGNTWEMPDEPVISTVQMRKRDLKTNLKEIIRQ